MIDWFIETYPYFSWTRFLINIVVGFLILGYLFERVRYTKDKKQVTGDKASFLILLLLMFNSFLSGTHYLILSFVEYLIGYVFYVFAKSIGLINLSFLKLSPADEIRYLVRIKKECQFVEFKSSFGMKTKPEDFYGKKEQKLEGVVFTEINAFLNSNKGSVLIGISDNGKVLGMNDEINKLHKESQDKFLEYFSNRLNTVFGSEFLKYIAFEMIDIEDKTILRIDCDKSTRPCYITDKKSQLVNAFYKRVGSASIPFEDANERERYIEECFRGR